MNFLKDKKNLKMCAVNIFTDEPRGKSTTLWTCDVSTTCNSVHRKHVHLNITDKVKVVSFIKADRRIWKTFMFYRSTLSPCSGPAPKVGYIRGCNGELGCTRHIYSYLHFAHPSLIFTGEGVVKKARNMASMFDHPPTPFEALLFQNGAT